MKKFLLIFSLLYGSIAVSQTYQPMPFNNPHWVDYYQYQNNRTSVNECRRVRVESIGDSTINTLLYKVLKRTTENKTGQFGFQCTMTTGLTTDTLLLRNDSLNKKVFIRPYYLNRDTILYDFNLSVGDTLKESFNYNKAGGSVVIVTSTDSIQAFNTSKYHRLLTLQNQQTSRSFVLIEGIGSNEGFLNNLNLTNFDAADLECHKVNGQMVLPAFTFNCSLLSTGIQELGTKEETVNIFPNPVEGDVLNITSNRTINKIQIVDAAGKLILTLNETLQKIDIINLPKGIYFLNLEFQNKETVVKKLIRL